MATDRIVSASSSVTAAEPYDDNEKMSEGRLKTPDEMDIGDDIERAELLSEHDEGEKPAPAPKPDTSTRTAVIWMVVNTLATIGIVCFRRLQYL